MFENTRGFFNEAAAILGSGLQDRVELALTHDDVHLTTDAGVAKKLLHIQESARLPVDGVLRPAVAKQRARDSDLGVLNGKSTIGVIDRECYLGATKRRSTSSAREDDVFHLAAAQTLGSLLAHDPGESIDNV